MVQSCKVRVACDILFVTEAENFILHSREVECTLPSEVSLLDDFAGNTELKSGVLDRTDIGCDSTAALIIRNALVHKKVRSLFPEHVTLDEESVVEEAEFKTEVSLLSGFPTEFRVTRRTEYDTRCLTSLRE